MHEPVLLHEVIEYLHPQPGQFIIDGTVDGGGHAAAIIKKIMPGGMFLGVDWDRAMIEKHNAKKVSGKNEQYLHGNYAELPLILEKHTFPKADGLLIDLGFSSEQIEASGRGFSFKKEYANEPLLMTYDDNKQSVAQILRDEDETSLANIIFQFGGERQSRRIAKAVKDAGKRKKIMTSGELAEIVRNALPKNYEHGRIDSATRTFQALRIYANGELENLKILLDSLKNILKPNGRAVIISFHSLEDGTIKKAFQLLKKDSSANILTKKPIVASREEIRENPRSRSAKLRAVQLI